MSVEWAPEFSPKPHAPRWARYKLSEADKARIRAELLERPGEWAKYRDYKDAKGARLMAQRLQIQSKLHAWRGFEFDWNECAVYVRALPVEPT